MSDYQTHEYDVLIIGAGGAGLRAAIEASAAGVKVGIICKSLLGKAHTVMAEGGMAASLGNVDGRDNWKVHFADTMRGGYYINDWRMAELHAQESPDRVRELESWGAVFDRTKEGKILQRNFGGHAHARLAHVGDRTGLELLRTLQDHGIHQGVDVHMEYTVVELLKDGGKIAGAFVYEREHGRFHVFKSKSVIIATGGLGRNYKITSNSWECTGDGQSLAYHAGADLMDMEFVQFHPTGMIWPLSVRGTLVTEGVRGEGGILTNTEGKRFMFEGVPDIYKSSTTDDPEEGWRYVMGDKTAKRPPELLCRDHVARKILEEVDAGRGSPHGGAYLNIAWTEEKFGKKAAVERIKRKLPSMYHQFKELAGVDITQEPMEVGPTTHYTMGGVKVDSETQMSTVDGLFACGECAAGLHGANRLGGNSLSDLVVFGARAGEHAAKWAQNNSAAQVNNEQIEQIARWSLAPFERVDSGENPFVIQKDLQDMMQEKVGIVRRQDQLDQAVDALDELKKRAEHASAQLNRDYNPGWHTALDLKNMLTVSEAIARCAGVRKESRGGHTRLDFEQESEQQGKVNTVVRKAEDGSMVVEQIERKPIREDLQQVIDDNK